MGFLYSFRVALRALAVNKGRTILTALGVIIGVGSVITMVGLAQGFGEAINKEINSGGANWVYISPGRQQNRPGPQRAPRLTLDDVKAIQRTYPETISAVVPVHIGSATVKYKNKSATTTFQASTPDYVQLANIELEHGSFYHRRDVEGGMKAAVLGTVIVEKLTGSKTFDMTGKTILINRQSFVVRGVLKSKGQFMDNNQDDTVLMPFTTAAQRFVNRQNIAFAGIRAVNSETVERAADQIRRTLRARHDIKPPYRENDDFCVMTPEAVMREVGTVTRILSLLLGSIAAISLLVGGIGIMNIMLVSVTERTREIGLRKAIGATTGAIMTQFLIESVMVSLLGGLVGVMFGLIALWGAAAGISANTPVKIVNTVSTGSILLAFGVSATIGIVFGLYPAWRAARLDPITALRYE